MVHAPKRLSVRHQGQAESRPIQHVLATQAIDSAIKTVEQLREFEVHAG